MHLSHYLEFNLADKITNDRLLTAYTKYQIEKIKEEILEKMRQRMREIFRKHFVRSNVDAIPDDVVNVA